MGVQAGGFYGLLHNSSPQRNETSSLNLVAPLFELPQFVTSQTAVSFRSSYRMPIDTMVRKWRDLREAHLEVVHSHEGSSEDSIENRLAEEMFEIEKTLISRRCTLVQALFKIEVALYYHRLQADGTDEVWWAIEDAFRSLKVAHLRGQLATAGSAVVKIKSAMVNIDAFDRASDINWQLIASAIDDFNDVTKSQRCSLFEVSFPVFHFCKELTVF